MTLTLTKAFDDYQLFHAEAVRSGDYDPMYPVLANLAAGQKWTREQTLWACMVFVAYYDLGSMLRVVTAHPEPTVPGDELLSLPCATERRAHRDPRQLRRHLAAVAEAANTWGGLEGWMDNGLGMSEGHDGAGYPVFSAWLRTLYGNGRWASYKSCELLAWVLAEQKIVPNDMGHAHSSGPRHGLELLVTGLPQGNSRDDIATLDRVSSELCERMITDGQWAPVSVVETTLCDFHALAAGRYYIGHDIDQMRAQLDRTPSDLTAAAYAARARALPPAYLSEATGREPGIDKERRTAFVRTGRILIRTPDGDAAASWTDLTQ